jgi:integrase
VVRESTGTTKERAAKKFLDARAGDLAHGVPIITKAHKLTFDTAMADLIAHYTAKGRKSRAHAQRRIDKHLLPFFKGRSMSAMTASDVRAYVKARLEQERTVTRNLGKGVRVTVTVKTSHGSVNRELALLKLAFRLAVDAGQLHRRPKIEMLGESSPRTGFFEREQFASVRSHLPEPLRPLATFFYCTGWRKSEVLSLEWRQVDFDAGTITLDPGTTKSGAGRVFPFDVLDELRTTLDAQRDERDRLKREGTICRWVFHRDGRQIKAYDGAWKTACRRAGVPGRIVHDFRRTAARNLVRAGVPERVAMDMTGHKTRSVFERYNIVNAADLRDAARRLNVALLKKQGTNPGTVSDVSDPTVEAQSA